MKFSELWLREWVNPAIDRCSVKPNHNGGSGS
jgi:hypothetical protein